MTDKTKMSNLESYTELSIQIATLEAKVDKLLELAMKPQTGIKINPVIVNLDGSVEYPPQWPNESRTDYMKRIGQYNEAQSIDEDFSENFK